MVLVMSCVAFIGFRALLSLVKTACSRQGAYFYRIIDRFIDQSGVDTESVFGGQIKDDAGGTALVHDRKGLLSMANMGPNTNTAHFSIMQVTGTHRMDTGTVRGGCSAMPLVAT